MLRSFGILLLVAALLGSVSAQTAVGIDLAGASFYSSSGATMTQVPHSSLFSLAVITLTPPTLSIRSWRDLISELVVAVHTLTHNHQRAHAGLPRGRPAVYGGSARQRAGDDRQRLVRTSIVIRST
jgi:hypothetical protein